MSTIHSPIHQNIKEKIVKQLIGALNKKLFMECVGVQSAMPPKSCAMVATLVTEVRSQEMKGKPEC
jgi:hypothetical protein